MNKSEINTLLTYLEGFLDCIEPFAWEIKVTHTKNKFEHSLEVRVFRKSYVEMQNVGFRAMLINHEKEEVYGFRIDCSKTSFDDAFFKVKKELHNSSIRKIYRTGSDDDD